MRAFHLAVALLLLCASASAQTFKIHKQTFAVGPKPSAIVAPDLNGDGRPEIVTANLGELRPPHEESPANDKLSYLLANRPLDYVAQPELPAGFAPYCIVAANIDALKALDLVVANFHTGPGSEISVFRNIGNNLFESLEFSAFQEGLGYYQRRDDDDIPIFTRPGITSIVVDFFNGDEYRDIVATGWSSDTLVLLPGAPTTYFAEPVFVHAEGGPRDIQAVDLDGDGALDLVTTLYNAGEVALWQGDGHGAFKQVAHFKSRGEIPHKIRVADINSDNKADLVVSHCFNNDSIVVFFGDGGFEFSASQEILLGSDRDVLEHEIRDIVVEDFDKDGRDDIAAACFASRQVVVLRNAANDNNLPQRFEREVYRFKEGRPRALCVADVNADGTHDIAVALWDLNAVGFLLGKGG